MSSKKLKRFVDPLRGKTVAEVESMLKFHPSPSTVPIFKVIHSAASNFRNKVGSDAPPLTNLLVYNIKIDQGPTLKRIKRRAMGRADIMCRRTSHITVVVKEK